MNELNKLSEQAYRELVNQLGGHTQYVGPESRLENRPTAFIVAFEKMIQFVLDHAKPSVTVSSKSAATGGMSVIMPGARLTWGQLEPVQQAEQLKKDATNVVLSFKGEAPMDKALIDPSVKPPPFVQPPPPALVATTRFRAGQILADNDPRMGRRKVTITKVLPNGVLATDNHGTVRFYANHRIFTDGKPRKSGMSLLPKCINDTDGDGDCQRCADVPGGCRAIGGPFQ